MNPKQPKGMTEMQQEQIEDLSAQVAETKTDIYVLQARADNATKRASTSERLASDEGRRTDHLEERVEVHDEVINALQAEGSIHKDQAEQLRQALLSSRAIGTAIGIIMMQRNVSDLEAFRALDWASQNSNRKLRVIAEEVVRARGLKVRKGTAAAPIDAV